MLTATYRIANQWDRTEIFNRKEDFETIGDLENFLAYNRAFIIELSFTGKLKGNN
jgi:hypothetical protein